MWLPLVGTPSCGPGRFGPRSGGGRFGPPGRLGMWLFLLSLSSFFAAALVCTLVFRARLPDWGVLARRLPVGVWISTALLLLSSVAAHVALRAARRDQPARLRLLLGVATLLGAAFLLSQALTWLALVRAGLPMPIAVAGQPALTEAQKNAGLFAFLFYAFSGIHGLHVLGGLAAFGFAAWRSFHQAHARGLAPTVLYCCMYWDFLDAVWLVVLMAILWPASHAT